VPLNGTEIKECKSLNNDKKKNDQLLGLYVMNVCSVERRRRRVRRFVEERSSVPRQRPSVSAVYDVQPEQHRGLQRPFWSTVQSPTNQARPAIHLISNAVSWFLKICVRLALQLALSSLLAMVRLNVRALNMAYPTSRVDKAAGKATAYGVVCGRSSHKACVHRPKTPKHVTRAELIRLYENNWEKTSFPVR